MRSPISNDVTKSLTPHCLSRDIVKASHLKPLDRKDIFTSERKQPWNSSASRHGSEPRLTDALLATRTNTLPETANEFNRQWRQCETSQDKSRLTY